MFPPFKSLGFFFVERVITMWNTSHIMYHKPTSQPLVYFMLVVQFNKKMSNLVSFSNVNNLKKCFLSIATKNKDCETYICHTMSKAI